MNLLTCLGVSPDIKLLENSSGLLLVKVVDDEEVGDVLALGHRQPASAPWMPIEVGAQVVKLVVDDPVFRSIATPQLGVPGFFLIKPGFRIALDASGWQ